MAAEGENSVINNLISSAPSNYSLSVHNNGAGDANNERAGGINGWTAKKVAFKRTHIPTPPQTPYEAANKALVNWIFEECRSRCGPTRNSEHSTSV